MDSRAGRSYESAPLVKELNREPDRREYTRIEMMMTWTTQKIEMYEVKRSNIREVFSLATTLSKVTKYKHPKGVEIDDNDIKNELPIHVMLGASDYAKVKPNFAPRVGSQKNQKKNSSQLARP